MGYPPDPLRGTATKATRYLVLDLREARPLALCERFADADALARRLARRDRRPHAVALPEADGVPHVLVVHRPWRPWRALARAALDLAPLVCLAGGVGLLVHLALAPAGLLAWTVPAALLAGILTGLAYFRGRRGVWPWQRGAPAGPGPAGGPQPPAD